MKTKTFEIIFLFSSDNNERTIELFKPKNSVMKYLEVYICWKESWWIIVSGQKVISFAWLILLARALLFAASYFQNILKLMGRYMCWIQRDDSTLIFMNLCILVVPQSLSRGCHDKTPIYKLIVIKKCYPQSKGLKHIIIIKYQLWNMTLL